MPARRHRPRRHDLGSALIRCSLLALVAVWASLGFPAHGAPSGIIAPAPSLRHPPSDLALLEAPSRGSVAPPRSSRSAPVLTLATQTPGTNPACPQRADAGDPTVEYCSPLFAGRLEGPNGSRVTALVAGVTRPPDQLYVDEAGSPVAARPLPATACGTGSSTTCYAIAPPYQVMASGAHAFVLTFALNLPTAANHRSFKLAAQWHASQLIESQLAFTVLTGAPPCVGVSLVAQTASAPGSVACATPHAKPLVVPAGAQLTITGENWLPDSPQTVEVDATCSADAQCSPGSFTLLREHPERGQLKATVGLPDSARGEYDITARNVTPDNVTPDQDGGAHPTLASGALLFTSAPGALLIANPMIPAVALEGAGVCTPRSPCQFEAGDALKLVGQGWRPNDRIRLVLIRGDLSCSAAPQDQGVVVAASSRGTFESSVKTTSASVDGLYAICANHTTGPAFQLGHQRTSLALSLALLALGLATASLAFSVARPGHAIGDAWRRRLPQGLLRWLPRT